MTVVLTGAASFATESAEQRPLSMSIREHGFGGKDVEALATKDIRMLNRSKVKALYASIYNDKGLATFSNYGDLERAELFLSGGIQDLSPLNKLRNLKALSITADAETLKLSLAIIKQFPSLKALTLETQKVLQDGSIHPDQQQCTITLPKFKSLFTLSLRGQATNYEYAKDFNVNTLQRMELSNSIDPLKSLDHFRNLRSLQVLDLKSIPLEQAKSIATLNSLEELSLLFCDSAQVPLTNLRRLRTLVLGTVDSVQFRQIGSLTKLEDLRLTLKGVNDNEFPVLANLHKLRKINIEADKACNGSGLAFLSASKNLHSLYLSGFSSEKATQALNKLQSLRDLTISGLVNASSPTSIATLKLKNLESLSIHIPDKQGLVYAKAARGMPNLKSWTLRDQNLTDNDLVELLNYSRLERVYLDENRLTDEGLITLSKLRGLRTLTIGSNLITGKRLGSVLALPALEYIRLHDNKIADTAIEKQSFSGRSVRRIDLSRNSIRGPGLRSFSKLEKLDSLTLDGNDITDDGLKFLPDTLSTISLKRTRITERGLESVAMRPNIKSICAEYTDVNPGFRLNKQIECKLSPSDPFNELLNTNLKYRDALVRIGDKQALTKIVEEADFETRPPSMRGHILYAMGRYNDALEAYLEVPSTNATGCGWWGRVSGWDLERFASANGIALCKLAVGDKTEAMEIAEHMAKDHPLCSQLRSDRGHILLQMGKIEEALTELNRAIELDPDSIAAYDYRSQVYDSLGNHTAAQRDRAKMQTLIRSAARL